MRNNATSVCFIFQDGSDALLYVSDQGSRMFSVCSFKEEGTHTVNDCDDETPE